MRAAAALWGNDLRHIVRDRTVAVLAVVPFLFVAFLRLGVPLAEARAPLVAGYRAPVVALFCLIAGTFPAFMLAFIMLDERDEGLFPVFRVLPISPTRLLWTRLAMVAALGFAYPLVIVAGSGLLEVSAPAALLLCALCGLQAPMVALVIVSLAGNKIEGLAVIKGIFPAVMFPAAGVIFASAWWSKLFAVVPAYWIYLAFTARDARSLAFASIGAVVLHGVVLAVFYRRFRRRVLP